MILPANLQHGLLLNNNAEYMKIIFQFRLLVKKVITNLYLIVRMHYKAVFYILQTRQLSYVFDVLTVQPVVAIASEL